MKQPHEVVYIFRKVQIVKRKLDCIDLFVCKITTFLKKLRAREKVGKVCFKWKEINMKGWGKGVEKYVVSGKKGI